MQLARGAFAKKHANRLSEAEVMSWPMQTFLERAKLVREGQITRATLLLLGQPTAAHWLLPHHLLGHRAQALSGRMSASACRFNRTLSELYQRIRNIQIRILPDHSLIPVEVSKYDRRVVLEALHNCIAHQDYERNGRIVVTERPATLVFENEGQFFEGQPDDYIEATKRPALPQPLYG